MDELETGARFGPYRIVARIGRGGMAEVYLATRTGPSGFARDLVIKRILPHLAADPEFVRMFGDEAAVLARLTHSNIAQVYDFGEIDGRSYLAMEYVRGESLHRVTRVLGRDGLPVEHGVRIAAEVARGLDYAHRATGADGRPLGIVHRDVSPTNVLLSFEGEVKLIDFGIARTIGRPSETRAGTVKGKVRYMSPEQCRGGPLGPRSDVFSLGVVLWEALAGTALYPAGDGFDVMEAIIHDPPPPPSRERPQVPPDLDDLVLRALAKDPGDRFPSADEMAQALDAFLARHGLLANAQLLAELLRARFAPTLVVPLDGEAARRPPLELAPTEAAVPPAGGGTVRLPPGEARGDRPARAGATPDAVDALASLPDGSEAHASTSPREPPAAGEAPARVARPAAVARPGVPARLVAIRLVAALIVALAAGVAGLLLWKGGAGPSPAVPPPEAPARPADAGAEGDAPGVAAGTAPAADAPRPAGPAAVAAGSGDVPSTPPLPDARDVPDAAPPPDGSSGEAGTAPVVATPPSTGRARIDSVPWSVVSWRGRTLGETPVLEAELPAGRQVLLLTDEHGREHRCSVRVVPGRLVKVRFDLAMDCR